MYQSTIFGTSERPACAAEGGAAPHPAGHELKRPRRNLLAGAGNADNDALTPAAMAAFQRRAHELHVAHAFEGVVGAALGHIHEMGNEIAADLFRVDEVRHAKRSPQAFLSGLRSTPMIMSAPTRRSPWMTLSPIPPRPKTTHFAPGSTLAVFWRVERNDVIAFLHRGHAGADVDNNAGALVAEDRGKEPLGVGARKGELVSVADSRRFDLDKHFAGARAVKLHVGHFQRFAGGEGTAAGNIHVDPQGRNVGGAKSAKVCMRRLQKQGRAMKLVTMYAGGT
jgi:hypothetical protein